MKSGIISATDSTVPAIVAAVVDTTGPTLRLGAVASQALDGAVDLMTLVIDPQAGKVGVLLDSAHAAIHTALVSATGNVDGIELLGVGDTTKSKVFTTESLTLSAPQTLTANSLSSDDVAAALAAALFIPAPVSATLSSAINSLEDALVNSNAPTPCVFMVCQATQTITVATYDTVPHAASAYTAALAAGTKQAEFLCTPAAVAGAAQFFE